MALEIERKFLVKDNSYKLECSNVFEIKQGFLNSNKNRVVRIRTINQIAYITIKGLSSNNGTTRYEWEKEIPYNEALELLQLCEEGIIEKKRYHVKSSNHIFEVDEFFGENKGLLIAEVELKTANEAFKKPNWLGKEVTGKTQYYNSELSKRPYSTW